MNDDRRDEEELREALSEAHRPTRHGTPEFAVLWSRAADRVGSRRAARRTRLIATTATVALAVAVTVGLWTADRRSRAELEEARTIAAAMDEWRAPLDYLLETPGRQWLKTTPSWVVEPATGSWHLPADLLQETRQ